MVGRVHAQASLTERSAIGVALALGMAMAIEGNGGDAATGHRLIDVPGIEGSISGDVGRKEAQGGHGADVEKEEVGDIAFVKGEGVLGQDHIAVDGIGARRNARTVAEEAFFFQLCCHRVVPGWYFF